MRLRRLFNIILIIVISLSADMFVAAASEMGAETAAEVSGTASAKKKKKKKKKTTKKSRKKKKRSKKRRSKKRKKRNRKKVTTPAPEPALNDSLTLAVNSAVLKWIPGNMNPGGLRVNSVKPDRNLKTAKVGLNENFTYLPVTSEFIADLKRVVTDALPDSISDYSVSLNVGKRSLAYYINKVDKLPSEYRKNVPFVWAKDQYANTSKGMQGDIVALWHSHGRYFKPGSGGWYWQRPLLFETAEDVFTMSYILNYVTPMMENAGAYVLLPRERDINRNEVIVDNDTNEGGELYSQPYYKELEGARKWENGEGEGFIYDLKDFRDTENPFEVGTYRQTSTIMSGRPSIAAWYADIPEDGEYAVYVSYETVENSTTDALYTVYYSGGSRQFTVNQTMGGGTWIYLGTFPLEAGYSDVEPVVSLSNVSSKSAGKIVTADAVKIGGGMGNIARSNRRSDIYYDPSTPEQVDIATVSPESASEDPLSDSDEEDGSLQEESDDESSEDETSDEEDDESGETEDAVEDEKETGVVNNQDVATDTVQTKPEAKSVSRYAPTFRTSLYPRYLEGSRYWLHWAGFPESVYSPYHGADDYKDDYTSRALWVNYLAGGSRVLPNKKGLNIPVDIALALHTDAGKRADDSIVGTLGIYYTNNGATYKDGTPRSNSRVLTDMVMRQITLDIRQSVEPNWKRRSMWDKSYVEARVPEVPTTLIELLSHQNFGDMQYGLDPRFQFLVGRSIYKAVARFIAERKDREVVIQPLPVKSFAITRVGKGKYRLSWQPTTDKLEPTAKPTKYIIFERNGETMGFNKIGETKSTSFDVRVSDYDVHSFKVVAANDGGMSFPSEILAIREDEHGKTPVLIVNGFTRICAPGFFNEGGNAGFKSEEDFGVPYIKTFSFSGHQTEFRRSAGDGFGKSSDRYITSVIAGNTFDFVSLHGQSIADAGYGFVSCAVEAVENGKVNLKDYKCVDLILGKQKETTLGKGVSGWEYKTFSKELQNAISAYVEKGGDILISGQYVVSDMYSGRSSDADREFISGTLGCLPIEGDKIRNPRIDIIDTDERTGLSIERYTYNNQLNDEIYIVEKPDLLSANINAGAEILMKFADTDAGAAILKRDGKSKSIVMSIPFETIKDLEQRNRLMMEILDYFDN